MKKRLFSVMMGVFAAVWCYSQTMTTGEDLFMHNKPGEAAAYFEEVVALNPGDIKTFLYLGIAYEQLGRADEAIAVYRQVLERAGELTANVANNLGNVYFKKGSVSEAEAMYTYALNADRVCASAYLGRANARIKQGMLREAVSDYEQYLLLDPRSSQRQAIERLIGYIKTEYAEAERKRLVAEEIARAEAEAARVAAEAARAEAERKRLVAEEVARLEAERRQRLLDEITASLQSAAGASQGLSTGAEDVEGYAGEFELE
jgi:tetratricopeptide (TPR) repeat protein